MVNIASLFKKDLTIQGPTGTLNSNDIDQLVKFYKVEINKKLNGDTLGKVVLLWTNEFDEIMPIVKAIWELGAVVAVHDFDPQLVNNPAFKEFYNFLNLVVGPEEYLIPWLPTVLIPRNVPVGDFPNIVGPDLDDDSICAVSHTSGTTGYPKIYSITHKQTIELAHECIRLFEFTATDRVMHFKTLHHGSLFLNYAIPALLATSDHVFLPNNYNYLGKKSLYEFVDITVDLCIKEKITKFLVPYDGLKFLADMPSKDLSALSLITIMGPHPEVMKKIFLKHNPTMICNNFGVTEVGTIAISKTTNKNVNEYSPTRFSHISQIVDITPGPHYFDIKFKSGGETRRIGDNITLEDNEFVWHSRNTIMSTNEYVYNVGLVDNLLRKCFSKKEFSLVPDYELGKLYLAVFDDNGWDLDTVNMYLHQIYAKHIYISKIQKFQVDRVRSGMKPSQPLLLQAFRRNK